jgi:lipoprotein-anchoring transpeptidase ErfK/SrfK
VDDIRLPKKVAPKSVGNDFIKHESRIQAPPKPSFEPALSVSGTATLSTGVNPLISFNARFKHASSEDSLKSRVIEVFQNYTIAFYAVLILILALIAAPLVRNMLSSGIHLDNASTPAAVRNSGISGLNTSVQNSNLTSVLNSVSSQPATLNLGSQSVAISPSVIKSWLQVSPSANKSEDNIHVSPALVGSSLLSLAKQYEKAPVNQVTITRADGSSEVAIAGQNGQQLEQPGVIASQAFQLSKNLMDNKGFQINAPLVSQPFQAVTPAAFSKLIVVDLNSKRMYAYQNSQLVNTFLVSAGKPSTPTPVGEFHIWDKLTSQTMTGPGYVQPNVPWVNYFNHSGDAIHGVYWRPASVFGNVNTSHGCVGVPVNIGEWIFNWAPIGTTVITTPA